MQYEANYMRGSPTPLHEPGAPYPAHPTGGAGAWAGGGYSRAPESRPSRVDSCLFFLSSDFRFQKVHEKAES